MLRATAICGLVVLIFLGGMAPATAAPVWNPANGPQGATAKVLHHDAQGRLYAGTDGRGVFRSDDRGASWYPLGLEGCTVYDVQANPSDPTMLAAACEFRQRGLFLSYDDGRTWEGCPLNQRIAPCIQVGFDPLDPERLYAGFMSDSLYYSEDRGRTWNVFPYSFAKDVGGFVLDFAPSRIYVDPRDSDRILVGTGLELRYIEPGGGFYLSTDRGRSWREILVTGYPGILYALEFSPGSAGAILASFNGIGVCRSLDGGVSWTVANPATLPMDLHYDREEHLWAVGTGASGWGAYESRDGATWEYRSAGLLGSDYWKTLAVVDGEVFCGEWGTGIFAWSPSSATWSERNNRLWNTSVHDAVQRGAGPMMERVAATFANGVFRRGPMTPAWRRANAGLDTGMGVEGFFSALAVNSAGTVFLGTEARGGHANIYRLRSGQNTWEPLKLAGFDGENILDLAISPRDQNLMYAPRGSGAAGVYRSTNGGTTWTFQSFPIQACGTFDVEAHPQSRLVAYACAWNGFLRTTNGGASWARVPNFNPSLLAIRSVAIDAANPLRIWVATTYDGLYRTVNGGTTWTRVLSWQPPTNDWPVSILIDPLNSQRVLIATDRIGGQEESSGVYETTNDGASWHAANSGLVWKSARRVRLAGSAGLLMANTADGVRLSSLYDPAVAQPGEEDAAVASRARPGLLPAPNARVFTVAPNPAPGDVQMMLELSRSGLVAIEVFDALGRAVRQIDRRPLAPGAYRFSWDGRDNSGLALPAGTYFCRVSSADGIRTERIVLVR